MLCVLLLMGLNGHGVGVGLSKVEIMASYYRFCDMKARYIKISVGRY